MRKLRQHQHPVLISWGYKTPCSSVWQAELDLVRTGGHWNKASKPEFHHLFLTAATTICDQRSIDVHISTHCSEYKCGTSVCHVYCSIVTVSSTSRRRLLWRRDVERRRRRRWSCPSCSSLLSACSPILKSRSNRIKSRHQCIIQDTTVLYMKQ